MAPGSSVAAGLTCGVPEGKGGGGGFPYEKGGNARRKFWIKPLKETNFFDP